MHRNGRHTEWSEKNEDWTEKNISSNSSKEEINVHTGLGYTICYMLYLDGLTPFPYTFFTSSFSSSSFSIYQKFFNRKNARFTIFALFERHSTLFRCCCWISCVFFSSNLALTKYYLFRFIFLDIWILYSGYVGMTLLPLPCNVYYFLGFFYLSLSLPPNDPYKNKYCCRAYSCIAYIFFSTLCDFCDCCFSSWIDTFEYTHVRTWLCGSVNGIWAREHASCVPPYKWMRCRCSHVSISINLFSHYHQTYRIPVWCYAAVINSSSSSCLASDAAHCCRASSFQLFINAIMMGN